MRFVSMSVLPRNSVALPRRPVVSLSLLAFAACVGGCDETADLFGPKNPPVADFSASPRAGQAPHAVSFDASNSSDPEEKSLKYRWDFDADGTFDTDFLDDATTQHVYETVGNFRPVLEVTDASGLTDTAEASFDINVIGPVSGAPRTADIDTDVNRDGVIDGIDEISEDIFTPVSGATLISNVDDDDRDGNRDRDDQIINGDKDLLDMTAVLLRQVNEAQNGDTVAIQVEPAEARDRIRIFLDDGNGTYKVIFEPTQQTGAVVDMATLGSKDIKLLVESMSPRSAQWNGEVRLTMQISGGGAVVSEDTIKMRVAPVIFPDNLQDPARLFVMRVRAGEDNNVAMVSAMEANLPDGVELYTTTDQNYGYDRWMQDNMEMGYQERVIGIDANGEEIIQLMRTDMQLQRSTGYNGLEAFLPNELLGEDVGFLYPGGAETSHNYGGNLEVAPPYVLNGVLHPHGRMLYGGGTQGALGGQANSDTMNSNQVTFLDAQEVQGAALELSSEWLAVGHIDEIFQFVPNRVAAPSLDTPGQKPYKLVVASPAQARQNLLDLQAAGGGNNTVFAGRDTETTVDDILGDASLMGLNEEAQRRIDSIVAIMKSELALTDADIVTVPVLYESVGFFGGGGGLVAALNPGIQNLVTVGSTLFVPDPEGPQNGAGVDIWQEQTRAALEPLGLKVEFVDVFNSYHLLLGEAHCGTNLDRAPYAHKWWHE